MNALSIRQPWADLIVAGVKDVENRSWATSLRGWILIHASQTYDWQERARARMFAERELLDEPYEPELGALIGAAVLLDCVRASESGWFSGPYGFELANQIRFTRPVSCRGALKFFEVDGDLVLPSSGGGDAEFVVSRRRPTTTRGANSR